jgi:hypothetical protein
MLTELAHTDLLYLTRTKIAEVSHSRMLVHRPDSLIYFIQLTDSETNPHCRKSVQYTFTQVPKLHKPSKASAIQPRAKNQVITHSGL